jgi:HK97 family phage major capsid protein
MIAKLNDAIVNGTGVGMPRGIIGSSSTVTVLKESAQAVDTVIYPNIVKMWNAIYGPWRRNAVWLINQDLEPQLDMLDFRPTAAAPTTPMIPTYLPGNTISGPGYSTLKGRPVIPCEACQKLGDVGDIILVDLAQYMTAMKQGGEVRTDVSIHLFFDQGVTAFRFIMRVAGQPWWNSPIKSAYGTVDRSWAAVMEAR